MDELNKFEIFTKTLTSLQHDAGNMEKEVINSVRKDTDLMSIKEKFEELSIELEKFYLKFNKKWKEYKKLVTFYNDKKDDVIQIENMLLKEAEKIEKNNIKRIKPSKITDKEYDQITKTDPNPFNIRQMPRLNQ
jgi:hypothetical protein